MNRINSSVQNQMSNQPCGCDCNCRPKFDADSGPGPVPGCNCQIGKNNYFVGDWSTGQSPFNTGLINLNVINGWNCPFVMSFRWVNVSFLYPQSTNVVLTTPTSTFFMTELTWYTVTLNPGDWIQFDFGDFNQNFDQLLNIEAKNATCAKSYGVVGTFTLVAI